MSTPLHLAQLTLFATATLLLLSGCTLLESRSASERRDYDPALLFYEPAGSERHIYKERPERLELIAFPYNGNEPPRGAVVFIHGGGWQVSGAELPLYIDWEEPLQAAGLRAFSIEHRTAPKYRGLDPVEDLLDALRYLQRNHARFGIPADRFVLVGFSSGGHLAVMGGLLMSQSAHAAERRMVRGVAAWYAPLDPAQSLIDPELSRLPRQERLRNYLQSYLFESEEGIERSFNEVLYEASPMENIHPAMPPTLLIHGRKDDLVPIAHSEAFYAAARRVRPDRVELHIVERAGHNFNISRSRWARRVESEAIEFLLRQVVTDQVTMATAKGSTTKITASTR